MNSTNYYSMSGKEFAFLVHDSIILGSVDVLPIR